MTTRGKLRLSVVIPCCNEEKNIGWVIENIKKIVDKNTEIIVIDDGSTDNTSKIAKSMNVKVFGHKTNMGKGLAIKTGIEKANGDIILFIDGDGQDNPMDIPKFIKSIEEGADFVNGSRWLGTFEEKAISRINAFATRVFTKMINLLFGANITDAFAGFRCIRKEKFKNIKLKSKEFEIEAEMVIKAAKHKLKIVEIPVTRSRRQDGQTKIKRIRHGSLMLWTLIREFFS